MLFSTHIFRTFSRRSGLVAILFIFIASFITSTLAGPLALADPGDGIKSPSLADNMSAADRARSLSYFVALKYCVRDHENPTIQTTVDANMDSNPSSWFDGLDGSSGYIFPDGKKDCKDFVDAALQLWNWTHVSFLQNSGYSYDQGSAKWTASANGNDRAYAFIKAVNQTVYDINNSQADPPLDDLAYYSMYTTYFAGDTCKAHDFTSQFGKYPTSNPTLNTYAENSKTEPGANPTVAIGGSYSGTLMYRRIDVVNPDTRLKETHVFSFLVSTESNMVSEYSSSTISSPTTVVLYGGPDANKQVVKTCYDIANELSRLAPIVAKLLAADSSIPVPGLASKACTNNGQCTTPDGGAKPSCSIDGIGWLVCPVMGFLGKVADQLFGFLASEFLSVDVNTVSTGSGTYTAWATMRNIANVAFVISFMLIIFSQVTNMGVSNYGIKKLLPRLVAAAILVNLSFYICQIAVDLSNILGYALKGLFDSVGHLAVAGDNVRDATGNGWGIAVVVTSVIAAGVLLAFAISVPVILAVLFALILIVMILLARKALIVLLVIISPLAFVAYLVPNTEEWYKKWQKAFFALLLVFPVISVVFGASSLAAAIIKKTNPGDDITQLMAIGVEAIPLIIVPTLLKGSLAAAGAIGATMRGWSEKGTKSATGGAKSRFQTSRLGQFNTYRKNEAEKRRGLIHAGVYNGSNKNPLNWGRNATSRINNAVNASPLSGKFGNRSAASGYSAAEQLDNKDIADQQLIVEREIQEGAITNRAVALQDAIKKNDSVRARAITNVLYQTASGRDEFHTAIKPIETNPQFKDQLATLKTHTSRNHGDMDTKDAAISLWSHTAPDQTLADMELAPAGAYNINDQKLSGQTKKGLVRAYYNNSLDSATATRILNDKDMERNLKPKEREFLTYVQSTGYVTPPSAPGTPPPTPPTLPPEHNTTF